jgi:hypothetical protein
LVIYLHRSSKISECQLYFERNQPETFKRADSKILLRGGANCLPSSRKSSL